MVVFNILLQKKFVTFLAACTSFSLCSWIYLTCH